MNSEQEKNRLRRLRLVCALLHVRPTEAQSDAQDARTCCVCSGGTDTWDFCEGCRHYVCEDCTADLSDPEIATSGAHELEDHTWAQAVH